MQASDADPSRIGRLIIVTGISGSGKTVALRALEDLNYYCIDNLPVSLMRAFAVQIMTDDAPLYDRVAVGIDIRNDPDRLAELPSLLEELKAAKIQCEVFFLDTQSDVLIKRFSETRRRHPLTAKGLSLPEALEAEQQALQPLRNAADWVLDTSEFHVHQLRRAISTRLATSEEPLALLLESFAYKKGLPAELDFAFDVRCLPNPHWEPELRPFTGREEPVAQFLSKQPMVNEMLDQIRAFLDLWIPRFKDSNRSYISVGIGCTGGRHRSVYTVEQLAVHFRANYDNVLVRHRELT